MNRRVKRFSLTNLSYGEEMKSKLDLIHNTTNAMIAQFDLHPKSPTKRKTVIQPKPVYSITKKRILQPLLRSSIQNNFLTDKFISHRKSQEPKILMNINFKSDTV